MKSGYVFILVTIAFTVLGQLLIKLGISKVASQSSDAPRLVSLITDGLFHPAVLAGLACAFIAAVSWFPAISRLPLTTAYPFMALPIVLVLLLTPLCFGERVAPAQWVGVAVVSLGLWIASR